MAMFDKKNQICLAKEGEISDVSAVILAGGLGTRLRSMVNDRPKVMAMVAGRPFVEWIVLSLQSAGIRHVVFCIGYLGEMIKEHFQDGADWGITIEYSCEQKLLGTGGALRKCLSHIHSDPVLVLNGDSYCQVNVPEYLQWHSSMPRAGSVVVVKTENPERFGSVQMESNGLVLGFKEKALVYDVSWINAGMYLLSQKLLGTIPPNKPISFERGVLPLWVSRGLWGFPSLGAFVDMGTPHGLSEAEEKFQSQLLNLSDSSMRSNPSNFSPLSI
jgi:NDP-sugar pyrophosphorylase family protein